MFGLCYIPSGGGCKCMRPVATMLKLNIAHPKLESADADAYVPGATKHGTCCISIQVNSLTD